MFLTSTHSQAMNAQANHDSERQNLLERLLDAVKQCQVRFGGKTELATDTDSRVACLLAQLEAVLQHGIRKPKGTARALRQVGHVAGIMKHDAEPVFWNFISEHLSKMDQERVVNLHNITTDAGRGRAWLRSTLNEHTLEKIVHTILGDQQVMRAYYEHGAFLRDEERASMLPMMAAGLSSILFALSIDSEELNAIKPVPNAVTSSKEVLSTILSSFPKSKDGPEPAPVYPEALVSDSVPIVETTKKKRHKKKKAAAIVSIDDGEGLVENLGETEGGFTSRSYASSSRNFPLDATTITTHAQSNAKGHSRSSSYPGKFSTGVPLGAASSSQLKSQFSEQFTNQGSELSRQISLSDTSLSKDTVDNVNWTIEADPYKDFKIGNATFYTGQQVNTIEEKEEEKWETQESPNFTFSYGDVNSSKKDNFSEISKDILSADSEVLNEQNEMRFYDPILGSINEKSRTVFENQSSFKSFKHNVLQTQDEPRDGDAPLGLRVEETDTPQANSTLKWKHGSSMKGRKQQEVKPDERPKVCPEDEPYTLIGSGEALTPVKTNSSKYSESLPIDPTDGEDQESLDRDSIQDDVSVSSSFADDEDSVGRHDSFVKARSESLTAATEAAVAALDLCAQIGDVSSMTRTLGDGSSADQEESSHKDSMSTSELKQAIVSMMLRKDEIEEENKTLRQVVEERRRELEGLRAEMDEVRQEAKTREERETATVVALTRENEVLKHQLKKYVSAVQLLRTDMKENQFNLASLGIRQDEVLPKLTDQLGLDDLEREEAKEYERKLIEVAEMHGELMEFNERLQRQINYWQHQTKRLREELINLRGPLPEDCSTADEAAHLVDFDPTVISLNTRPLISVWIPSVFMKGRGSSGVHLYQVYIRIRDEEWNVYRRYSQFYDLHKKLCKKHSVVGSFKFPPKKTIGNKGTRFVEERRKLLQDYLRRVVNLLLATEAELDSQISKAALLELLPFFGWDQQGLLAFRGRVLKFKGGMSEESQRDRNRADKSSKSLWDPFPPDKPANNTAVEQKLTATRPRGSDPYTGL